MSRTLSDSLRWVAEGTALVQRALAEVGTEDALGAPSALPGWTRKHLLAHIAANADAVGNLVRWAATSVPTPMYSSPKQRNADIEAGSHRSASDLLEWFDRSAAALDDGFDGLSDAAWRHEVVTAQGRTVPASETPWMRTREVMVHAVDLDGGVTFDDLPADFLVALASDIVAKRASGGDAFHVSADDTDQGWQFGAEGVPTTVVGPLAQVVAWLAGRPHHDVTTTDGGPAPILPPWL